jgi:hypothetical protein
VYGKTATPRTIVRIRILTYLDNKVNVQELIQGTIFDQNNSKIEMRHLHSHLQVKVTTLVVDRKFSLEVEVI